MKKKLIIFLALLISSTLTAQTDTLEKYISEYSKAIDTLNLIVKDIVFSGNKITKDEIILREMTLKKGQKFTLKKLVDDHQRIYNLGLFTRVDIIPVPLNSKQVMINVDVQERWYIFPLPNAGIDDGEWKKVWLSANLRWDNFRGRNEQLNVYLRIFYNPAVSLSYSVPWIGKKLHLFAGYSIGYSKNRNKSLIAVGRGSEGNTILYNEENYDNYNFHTDITIGKFLSKRFAVFTDFGFNSVRVSEYAPGRTISTSGKDRFFGISPGVSYDSRDIIEYATKGYFARTAFTKFLELGDNISYSRASIESQSFIPLNITKNYYLTLASRAFTDFPLGGIVPLYDHQFLGYSDNLVRGWRGEAYEGEGEVTVFNELRIPILRPRYVKAGNMIILKHIPVIKNFDLRYGLNLTVIYDVGTVFNHNDNIFKKRFQSGTGIGINFIAPFGYVLRADWVFRLTKPIVGQIGFNLYAKF